MPELPEVETVARSLFPHVHNCVFESAKLLRPSTMHPASLPLDSLVGQKVVDLRRRGKLLLFELYPAEEFIGTAPDGLSMIVHLRMTGRILTCEANTEIGRHTRCVWNMRKPDSSPFQLFFDDTRTFGKIFIATEKLLTGWNFWRTLGPEPLELDPENFIPRLSGKRPIKTSLLDQSIIAGIGNIYADEALYASGIDPRRPSSSLTPDECGVLLGEIKKILTVAIANKGSSIRDYRDADGKAGKFQESFAVYGRGDKPCRRCGTVLLKARLGGRATVFCPHCQK